MEVSAAEVRATGETVKRIGDNISRAVQVRDEVLHNVLVCLLAEGHVLVEDYPGVGKTALARALSKSLACQFARVQCTADLLPADIVGTNIFNQREGRFEFRPGPIMANIVLVDEVNRASPKTQSGLLECMQERSVTVDVFTHELARPFMVFATQNPVEYEGTYPLPEAQVDRFMARLSMGYPTPAAEAEMLSEHEGGDSVLDLEPVVDTAEILAAQDAARRVHASRALRDYIVALLRRTREDERVELGASPRAGLMLLRAAKAHAVMNGRDHALPDDVQVLAEPLLAHRLMLIPEAAGSKREDVVRDAVQATPALSEAEGLERVPDARAEGAGRSALMRSAAGCAALGVVLLLVAGTFDAEPFYVTGAALVLLGAGAAVWIFAGAWGVSVHREVGARSVMEDEKLSVRVEVRAGRLPLPPGYIDEPLLTEPAPLRAGRRVSALRIEASFGRRGRRRLQPVSVVLRDPLGLAERTVSGALGGRGARAPAHRGGAAQPERRGGQRRQPRPRPADRGGGDGDRRSQGPRGGLAREPHPLGERGQGRGHHHGAQAHRGGRLAAPRRARPARGPHAGGPRRRRARGRVARRALRQADGLRAAAAGRPPGHHHRARPRRVAGRPRPPGPAR